MKDIESQVIEWHRETFPNATIRAISDKFFEEAEEFLSLQGDVFTEESAEEFADMCIVFMSGLARCGLPSLTSFIEQKLEINKNRKWGKELPNGDRPREK